MSATASSEGFVYDAFLSYRRDEPDRSFAHDLLNKLEGAGLQVAIDERDFRPEATFLEEMERCIRESRFTLAILSPRYLDSGNTIEEAIICKVLDMRERRRRLIPLLLVAEKSAANVPPQCEATGETGYGVGTTQGCNTASCIGHIAPPLDLRRR